MNNQQQPNPAVLYILIFIAVFTITFFGLKMMVPQSVFDQLGRDGTAKVLVGYVVAVGAATLATAMAWRAMRPKRKGQPQGADLNS